MAVIFYLSSQAQSESVATSDVATAFLYKILSIFFKDTIISGEEFFARYGQTIREMAHFTEFFILGILAYVDHREFERSNVLVYPIIFSVLYAISDEFHQLFVPGRYCDIRDMAVDISGAICGIFLSHLFMKWRSKRK